ncbi:NAD-dependent protein deacetylase [Brachybacterium halotolerans subsp. kimchii]|uniref:Sir2 family NAD-dependent protein deacetylase n=1 Tax=Brachybacterium halotolerans TaxID=2795215 RepID=UPI001E440F80|nr:Sir2 family NAD-dependent protein deacetylase [Brachybacterium halotolerans]UEJ84400.1 NAD-dependent protein deacetylase [Brachybacterium halotolerans subsp. kimchii]
MSAGRAGPAADVGRWFSTGAQTASVGAPDSPNAPSPNAPRTHARDHPWGPADPSLYGRLSTPEEVLGALDVLRGGPVTVLTGAGLSTESGLPDYRGPRAVPRTPMTYQEFVRSDLSRRRYWARSTVGWTQFGAARPNRGHRLLAALAVPLEIRGVITQNVDRLHEEAGSEPVVDLHGRLDVVRCLDCDATVSRDSLHSRLLGMNPDIAARLEDLARDAAQAPDGDAEVDRTSRFRYPPCAVCGGMLKPDVVFFGESARREMVADAFALLERSRALLVLGSSLTVMSGLRFARQALADGKPVVIVNDGPTRADDRATVRVHGRVADVLGAWALELGVRDHPGRHRSR